MPTGGFLTIGAAALGSVQGGAQLFSSLHKLRKDKEELAKLKTPFYKVQDEYYQNRNMANEMAQGGLGAATKDYATTQGERGLGAGIKGILGAGGDPNDISHLFDSYDRSIDRISSADAQAHLDNIKYFTQANKDLAGQKTTQWGLNEYKPYQDKLSELTARRGADEKSAWNGASGLVTGIGNVGTAIQNQGLLNSVIGKNKAEKGALDRLFNTATGGADGSIGEPFVNSGMTNDSNNPDYLDPTATAPDNTELFQMFQQFLANKGNGFKR